VGKNGRFETNLSRVQINEKDEEDQRRILPMPKPKMQRILHAAKLLRHNLKLPHRAENQLGELLKLIDKSELLDLRNSIKL
jgi:hypothetical protein